MANETYDKQRMTSELNVYSIGSLNIDSDRCLITFHDSNEDTRQHKAEPRVIEVLRYFYQHQNQLVSREQLIDEVWQGQIVSDNAINRTVSQCRKILNLISPAPAAIETVPRKGYVFTCFPDSKSSAPSTIKSSIEPMTKAPFSVELENNSGTHNGLNKPLESPPESSPHSSSFTKNKYAIRFSVFIITIMSFWFIIQNISNTQQSTSFEIPRSTHPIRGTLTPITSLAGTEGQPKISPNSKWLVFTHQKTGEQSSQLFLQSTTDTKLFPLTDNKFFDFNPSWSHDGTAISFTRWSDRHQRLCSVHKIQLTFTEQQTSELPAIDQESSTIDQESSTIGQEPSSSPQEPFTMVAIEKLFDCGARALVHSSWSSDNKALYFNDRSNIHTPYSIYRFSLATKKRSQISLPPQDGNLRGDFFVNSNPFDSRIVVLRYLLNENTEILILDKNHHLETNFTLPFQIYNTQWFQNKEQLLFVYKHQIVTYDTNKKSYSSLYSLNHDTYQISSNKTGSELYFSTGEIDSNLKEYRLLPNKKIDSDQTSQVTFSTAIDMNPLYDPFRENIIFISNRTGKNEYWTTNNNNALKKISDFDFDVQNTPYSLSPNGEKLLFQHNDELYTLQLDNQSLIKIVDQQHHAFVGDWGLSDNTVIYSSDKTGDWQLWQFSLNENIHTQLTHHGGYSGKVDAEGNLYYSKLHHDGLWKLPKTSSNSPEKEQRLIEEFPKTNWQNWVLRKGNIYYYHSKDSNTGIYRFNIQSKSTEFVVPFNDSQRNSFDVNQSESSIVITEIDRIESQIYRLNLSFSEN